jgi:hypothetical protein
MLRALKTSLRAKLRMLWEQCDLFEAAPIAPVWERPEARPPRPRPAAAPVQAPRAPRTNPRDRELVARLTEAHGRYNAELFGGTLRTVPIRISRRMKNRLGHYMTAAPSTGQPPEIALSRRHIDQDSWDEVIHTLVHEMVHQWQDENGHPLDHGQTFRRKAREIGISARATRPVRHG